MKREKHKHKAARSPFQHTKTSGIPVRLDVCECGDARWAEGTEAGRWSYGRWGSVEEMAARCGDSINRIVHTGDSPASRDLVWELALYMTACDDEIVRQA